MSESLRDYTPAGSEMRTPEHEEKAKVHPSGYVTHQ